MARELSGFVWDIVRREMPQILPAAGYPSDTPRPEDALDIG